MKYYLISIFFLLLSCNGQKKLSVKNEDSATGNDSSLELLLQDDYLGFEEEETIVIKDQKRLQRFYMKLNRTRKPGLPVPVIDFANEMVIVQCAGGQNQMGVQALSFLQETDAAVILKSELLFEPSSKPSDGVINHPFCLYKMPLNDKEVVVQQGIK